jgi:diguanylate cyclase (GGDEF)-like protein/PAS domain S-box-containing protein
MSSEGIGGVVDAAMGSSLLGRRLNTHADLPIDPQPGTPRNHRMHKQPVAIDGNTAFISQSSGDPFRGDDAFMRPAHWQRGRIAGAVGLAAFAALAPDVGPHRWWLVVGILALLIPATIATGRWVPPRQTANTQAATDVFGCIAFVHLIPQHWTSVLVVGLVATCSNVVTLGARGFVLGQAMLALGMGFAASIHGVDGWWLPLATMLVVTGPVASYANWLHSHDALLASRLQDMTRSVAAIVWEAEAPSGRLLRVMGPTDDVTGHRRDQFQELYPAGLMHPEDLELVGRELPTDGSRIERSVRIRHRDGHWVWLREVIGLVEGADGRRYVRGVAFDISDLQHARQALADKAERDDLTGLLGRDGLYQELQRRLAESTDPVGLLLMDLDGFKNINDTMGHPTGDRLLQAQAERLVGVARSDDVVGRLGGDEFLVITSAAEPRRLLAFGRRINEALEQPVLIDGVEMVCAASIGVSASPGHGTTPDDLVRNADHAMYQAKRSGLGVELFKQDSDRRSVARLARLAELSRGMDDQIELWFQPIMDVASGHQVSMEGLARWRHPTEGIIGPNVFIEMVESAGLTVRFDTAMVRRAVEQLARLGPASDLTVSVNVSQRGLADQSFTRRLRKQLAAMGVESHRLIVEISERDVDSDQRSVLRTLAELRELGVGISLDDFGTGYSSLSRLRGLPITEIKIDHGFVTVMNESPADAIIVRSTVEMARELGLGVVAEGVSDEAILEHLRELGCTRAQGFLFGAANPKGTVEWSPVESP